MKIATASIPCKNGFFDADGDGVQDAGEAWVNQCGTGGSYVSTGSFNTNEVGSITCPDSVPGGLINCVPVLQVTVIAEFNGLNETLRLS